MFDEPTRRGIARAFLVTISTAMSIHADSIPQSVSFNRDIRPILSDKCFTCHGPDAANRKSKLRFDHEEGARIDLGKGRYAMVPGDPAKSELYLRISSENPALRMPPTYAGHEKLTGREIDLIRRWIEQGAVWQRHWSLLPPHKPDPPKVQSANWPRNAIDYFVLDRLEREGLRPAPEADKSTLIRRASLDVTGLPPTPAEVESFLQDSSSGAYEKVVDRLLSSPRYAERMAYRWMEAARYADTNGYQTDGVRDMWRCRDWVIEAFQKNMPFDQFTREQLAGDLLPNPTLDQRIATGFNRNHRGNAEGGVIPEEYAVEYVVDRVDTTATVWLGLTMGCARCHEHKFDPFRQKEYYQLFAYFNNVPEFGRAIKYGNSPPMIPAPTRAQQEQLRRLDARLRAAESKFLSMKPELARVQAEWEKSDALSAPVDWTISRGVAVQRRLASSGTFDGKHAVEVDVDDDVAK